MKVLVAGASGALGAQLVPKLVAAGHQVVAMTKTESKQDGLRRLGARPVVVDALDPDAVGGVVGEAEPDVIVHEHTTLSGPTSMRDARHPAGRADPLDALSQPYEDRAKTLGESSGVRYGSLLPRQRQTPTATTVDSRGLR
jgi:uncharacterized protein YbjT (DUF2867 family)